MKWHVKSMTGHLKKGKEEDKVLVKATNMKWLQI